MARKTCSGRQSCGRAAVITSQIGIVGSDCSSSIEALDDHVDPAAEIPGDAAEEDAEDRRSARRRPGRRSSRCACRTSCATTGRAPAGRCRGSAAARSDAGIPGADQVDVGLEQAQHLVRVPAHEEARWGCASVGSAAHSIFSVTGLRLPTTAGTDGRNPVWSKREIRCTGMKAQRGLGLLGILGARRSPAPGRRRRTRAARRALATARRFLRNRHQTSFQFDATETRSSALEDSSVAERARPAARPP